MSLKVHLKVFVNSDIAHLVWQIEKRIPHLLGFAVEKRILDEHNKVIEEEYLKSWIGFPGRQEKVGEHVPTTQWPIQEFQWSDHTCLYNECVSYRVAPVIGTTPEDLRPNMAGASDWSTPQTLNGRLTSGACFEAYFNRGIVASQWLNILLDKMNAKHPASALDKLIADPSDHTRKYLGGSLRHAMLDLLAQAHKTAGTKVYLCLYELDDPELMDYLQKLGKKAHIILANGTHTPEEPDENARSRQELRSSGVNLYDRIITASGVLAHNKFVVFTEGDKAVMAWTGSTNWTKSGLCTQCNNGLLIRDERIATVYLTEWHHLKSLEGETGKDLRKFNESLAEKASITIQEPGNGPVTIQQWFSPITGESDLDEARRLIANAQHGILFLMFNPGPKGTLYNAIVDAAKDPHKNLHIEGVINQDPSTQTHPVELLHRGHIDSVTDADVVLPAAMDGFPDHWVKELKMKRGAHAMIHSKCIVIDPFSENPVVITGSHNMGPKASKLNDDNMVIIRGSKSLARAYAVNIMAIYIHYRWRYHSNFEAPGAHAFSSLSLKDSWQDPFLTAGTEKRRELQFWFGQPFDTSGRKPQAIQHINGAADDSGLVQAVEELSISEKKPKRRAQKKKEEEEEEDEDEEEEKPAPRRRARKAEVESKATPARAARGRRGDDDAYHPSRDDGGEDEDEDEEEEEDEDYEPEETVQRKAGGARKTQEKKQPKPKRKVAARRKKDEYDDEDEDEDDDDDYESEPEKTTRRKAAPRKKVDAAPVARPPIMSGGGGQRNESSEGGCVVM